MSNWEKRYSKFLINIKITIILFGKEYWEKLIDFEYLADLGLIEDDDLHLFKYADTPLSAWKIIKFYSIKAWQLNFGL